MWKKSKSKITISHKPKKGSVHIKPRGFLEIKNKTKPLYLLVAVSIFVIICFAFYCNQGKTNTIIPTEDKIETTTIQIDSSKVKIGINIQSDLWTILWQKEIPLPIQQQIEEALKWDIDLYHLGIGSTLKFIYEVKKEGLRTGYKLLALVLKKENDSPYYAFYAPHKNTYYDQNGFPKKKQFLMAPVNFQHISSPYNSNRINPISKQRTGHFGTDYAAPKGTPVFSVADGKIIALNYNSRNGYYIKIRHDDTYQTQYLHLSKQPVKGILAGEDVKQGQIIGYIGLTGHTTGPHVCFRFWKNNRQINHYEAQINQLNPDERISNTEYLSIFTDLREQLVHIEIPITQLSNED